MTGEDLSPTSVRLQRAAQAADECVTRTQRIGLFGLFGTGNFGNDASLESVLSFLRETQPAARYVCICPKPARISAKYAIEATNINWRPSSWLGSRLSRWLFDVPVEVASLAKAIRTCRDLDVLIIPGTGVLDDFTTGPRRLPYWLFRLCVLARWCDTKIMFVSVGAGPIRHPVSRWLMRKAAEQADYRSYRDEISRAYMSSIGCDVGSDPVYPDLVFALSHPKAVPERHVENDRLCVGVGVMSYNGWRGDKAHETSVYDAYMSTLQRFVCWLVEQGHQVRLIMGDNSDASAVEDLSRGVRADCRICAEKAVIAEPVRSLREVMDQIAMTDVVVATRFHNVVCALSLGRPVISIGYAEKNDVLLAQAGLGALCQHIEHVDVERLKEQFTLMAENRAAYVRSARDASTAFAEQLREQNKRLLSEGFV